MCSSKTLYLSLFKLFMNNDQGLYCDNDSIPSSHNKFNNAGLKPDIIEAFGRVDNF